MCELFVGGGSTSATSVLLRRRYPLTIRGYLFALRVGGLAVAGPCPTSTLIRSYPGELERSLSATCDSNFWPTSLLFIYVQFLGGFYRPFSTFLNAAATPSVPSSLGWRGDLATTGLPAKGFSASSISGYPVCSRKAPALATDFP